MSRNRVAALSAVVAAVLLILSACSDEADGVTGSGTVEATEVTVSARVQGELLSVHVDEGDRVDAGSVLAEIDTTDIRLQLEQQRQRVEMARAQLDLLTAGARREDIMQAEEQLAQARIALDLARKSYERVRRLYDAGSATESERDRLETEFRQATSRVAAAEAQLAKVRSITRPEEIRSARARVAEAEAGIQLLEERADDAVVRSPMDGVVTTRAREAGEYVAPGTPLFTIADLSSVYLTIYVPQPMLSRFSLGAEAVVSLDGMPNRSFAGRVSRIAEEAEFTPKNVQTRDARAQLVFAVEITLDNTEGIFKIGMPADARIVMEESP